MMAWTALSGGLGGMNPGNERPHDPRGTTHSAQPTSFCVTDAPLPIHV